MKKNRTLLFVSLALALMLALGAAISANAAGSLNKDEIDAIIETDTDQSLTASPFTAAVKEARQSVVLVNNYTVVRNSSRYYGFGFGFGFGDSNGSGTGSEQLAGTGSGTVISDYGHILTNYHVVEDATRVTVYDGENEYDASVVATDEDKDIAVLLCPEINLPAAPLGDSDQLQEGEWAIVIGNPLGEDFFRSTTVGVISSLERDVESEGTDRYGRRTTITNSMIQVDAAINAGNSGGGMFNVLGQLMGIPSLKYTSSFLSSTEIDNIGMCIPINVAKPLIREALEDYNSEDVQDYLAEKAHEEERITSLNDDMADKPRLGVRIVTLDDSNAAVARGVLPRGVLVNSVDTGSAAEEAGIQAGDIIVDVDDEVITSSEQLQALVAAHGDGDTLHVKVYRAENVLNAQYVSEIGDGEYIDLEISLRVVEQPAA